MIRPSFTAEAMALQRAFESHRPSASRLFCDPYADAFLHGTLRLAAVASRLPLLRDAVARAYDAIAGPGARPSAIARTRAIDEILESRAAGGSQLVLLGAGFDTRAHRLAALRELHVFEVDHPTTQQAKRAVATRLGLAGASPAYVPVDFEHDALDQRLVAAGYDPGKRATFLWEGVTNYLTAEAVHETLVTVARLAGAGGTLVFTYVDAGVLDGSAHFPEAARWLRGVERAGEPWIFGLHPKDVASFLSARGYVLESDTSTAELGARYFVPQGRPERGSALYHVAVARIQPSGLP